MPKRRNAGSRRLGVAAYCCPATSAMPIIAGRWSSGRWRHSGGWTSWSTTRRPRRSTTGSTTSDEASVEGAFRANVFAQLLVGAGCRRHMKPGGAIVNTCSVQLRSRRETMLVYAATKGAIASLTIGLSNLLAPQGHPRELRRAGAGMDPDPADRQIARHDGDSGPEHADRPRRSAEPSWHPPMCSSRATRVAT